MIESRQLTGKALGGLRIIWFSMTLLILVLYAIGIPTEYNSHIQTAVSGFKPELDRLNLSIQFYATYRTVLNLSMALTFLVSGLVIYWRKPTNLMVTAMSLAMMSFGSLFVPTLLQIMRMHPELVLPVGFVRSAGLALSLIVIFYLFPTGRLVPVWTKPAALIWALISIAWWLVPQVPANLVYLDTWQANMALSYSVFLVAYTSGIIAQVYRYKQVLNPVQRQQTKWVIFGSTTAFLGFVIYHIPLVFIPGFDQPTFERLMHIFFGIPVYHAMLVMAPLTIMLSILRYRLWDIDFLINRSIVSGLLTLALGALYFGSVVSVSLVLSTLTGQNRPAIVTAIATLVVAAAFNPLRRRLRRSIDRRFYRKKYDTILTLNAFGSVVRNEVDLHTLTYQLMKTISETMEPRSVSVWLMARRGEEPQSLPAMDPEESFEIGPVYDQPGPPAVRTSIR